MNYAMLNFLEPYLLHLISQLFEDAHYIYIYIFIIGDFYRGIVYMGRLL